MGENSFTCEATMIQANSSELDLTNLNATATAANQTQSAPDGR